LTIVAVSDVHLGYKQCNRPAFANFLDYIASRNDVTDLVVVGDFLDMWRRDIAGVVLESIPILDKLVDLQKSKSVHYIVGNHDYHMLSLKDHGYQFNFKDSIVLGSGNLNCRFLHGWEFDPSQNKIYFEALCHSSDETGEKISEAWDFFTSSWTIWGKLWSRISGQRSRVWTDLEHLLTPAEARLTKTLDVVNKNACNTAKPGELLVFGHTHWAFIAKAENVVNTGCWVKGATRTNTYVEIEAGKPKLLVFDGEEITERIEC